MQRIRGKRFFFPITPCLFWNALDHRGEVDISSLCQTPFGNPRSLCLSFLKGGVFFLSSLKIGSQMGVSWAMNLLMYCSLPKKALISFSVFGTGMPIIALAFAGRLRFLFCWQWTRVAYLTKHQTSSRLYMLLRMKTVFPQSVKHFLQIKGLLQPKTWRSCHRHRPPFPCESYHEMKQRSHGSLVRRPGIL